MTRKTNMYGYIFTEFLINGEDRLRTLCLVIRLNSFERQFFKKTTFNRNFKQV